MEYFFIAGNVASLAALVGFLFQVGHLTTDNNVTRWTFGIATFLTAAFWLYFYLRPKNIVKKTIQARLDYTGSYKDSSNRQIEIFEGEFSISGFETINVPLPPFEAEPTIAIFQKGNIQGPAPWIGNVTLDSFEAKAYSSAQLGAWRFRARGSRLMSVDGPE